MRCCWPWQNDCCHPNGHKGASVIELESNRQFQSRPRPSGRRHWHGAAALRGMVSAPHDLATQAGVAVLREGGNAIEAMVAAAATIAVVYPHMNGIGGDCFWLIVKSEAAPIG